MASLKEERCWFFALLIGIILQIVCLSLEWTHAEYPLRFSKSQYSEQLNLQSGYPFFGSEFRGGIVICLSGCYSAFQSERSDWCEISDHLKEVCPGCIEENYALSLCKFFKNQHIIGIIFCVLSGIFIVAQLIYALTGIFDPELLEMGNCKCFNIFILYCAAFSILLCWILWFGLGQTSYLVFGHNCKEFPTDGGIPNACLSYGAYFGFASLAYISLVYCWGSTFKLRKYFETINAIPRLNGEAKDRAHKQYPNSEYAKPVEPESKEGLYENNNQGESDSKRSSSPGIIMT